MVCYMSDDIPYTSATGYVFKYGKLGYGEPPTMERKSLSDEESNALVESLLLNTPIETEPKNVN